MGSRASKASWVKSVLTLQLPTRRLGLALALMVTVWVLGFPWFIDVLLLPLLVIMVWRVPIPRVTLVLVSSWLSLGLAEAGLRILARWGQPASPYYRPEEQVIRRNHYEPGVNIVFDMPHGDLVTVEPGLRSQIAEPRRVRFRTDSLGYRNDTEFSDQRVLIVGDSFVVGSGNRQEALLANVLERECGLRTYSLGFPVSPPGLLRRIREFLKSMSSVTPPEVLLFIFEGNDFATPSGLSERDHSIVPPRYDQLKIRWIHRLGFHIGNRVFSVTRQLINRAQLPDDGFVEVATIAGKSVGFLGSYIDTALAADPQFELPTELHDIAARLRGVFFIPTKYRVYQRWIEQRPDRSLSEPAPALIELRRHFTPLHVPVVDLTPALRQAAATALAAGEFVYWRDDSHWNARGVEAAAAGVVRFLKAESAGRPKTPSMTAGEEP